MQFPDVELWSKVMPLSLSRLIKGFNNLSMLWMCIKIRTWGLDYIMIASALSYHSKSSHPNSNRNSHNCGRNNRSSNWLILNITWDHWMWKWVAVKWKRLLNGFNHLSSLCAKILHPWLRNRLKKLITITKSDSSSWNSSLSSSRLCILWLIIARVSISKTLNILMYCSLMQQDVLKSDNNYPSKRCLEDIINASMPFMGT